MIEITGLEKRYGTDIVALRDVSINISTGMFGLVGPNGAGKTTLMRIVAGILKPTAGTILVNGHDVNTAAGKRAVKKELGYLPQELGLYPNLTAREFLDYVAVLKGVVERRARRRQIGELLALVRLTDAADRRLKTYSGGMKRRVGIAQALLGQPRLIIVDEPTAGLDPEERVRLRNLLGEVAARCTVMLSTHIVEDISQSCRALAVLNNGLVVFQGSPQTLIGTVRNKVWHVHTAGAQAAPGGLLVSSLPQESGVQYRLLGELEDLPGARPAEPTLEDAYLWLMNHHPAPDREINAG